MKRLNVNTTGNKKLKNTDTVRFMIWNLPAQKTCPFATELCKKACYAKKAEKQYKPVLPCRKRNYTETLSADFVNNMVYTIKILLNSKAYRGKKAVFRIHESGDFYSLDYAKKWVEIAKQFKNDNRIVFLAYTKSVNYFYALGYDLNAIPLNFVIRSSLWKDTAPEMLDITYKCNFPVYTALTRSEMDALPRDSFTECRCSDCATCGKCWDNSEKNIICEIH